MFEYGCDLWFVVVYYYWVDGGLFEQNDIVGEIFCGFFVVYGVVVIFDDDCFFVILLYVW